jgi:hypothetical protein
MHAAEYVIIIIFSNNRPPETCYGYYQNNSFNLSQGFPNFSPFLVLILVSFLESCQSSYCQRARSNFFAHFTAQRLEKKLYIHYN